MKPTAPLCRHCNTNENVKLRRRITGDGSQQVYWFCLACNKGAQYGEPSIKHQTVIVWIAPHTIDEIPIVSDYVQESPPCFVCGAKDTQFHHWLPQMFANEPEVEPEWDVWANVGAPLCRNHHALWHRIVTPYMPGIGQSRK